MPRVNPPLGRTEGRLRRPLRLLLRLGGWSRGLLCLAGLGDKTRRGRDHAERKKSQTLHSQTSMFLLGRRTAA